MLFCVCKDFSFNNETDVQSNKLILHTFATILMYEDIEHNPSPNSICEAH